MIILMERVKMIEIIEKILSENAQAQLNLSSTACRWILARQIADALSSTEREGSV